MGYDLVAKNEGVECFTLGAFSWGPLMEACGYLWPCISHGGQWYCTFGADERMPQGDDYPKLLTNDGFPVTDEEAKIMARIARNLVAVQRSLPESHAGNDFINRRSVNRVELIEAMQKTISGRALNEVWPVKIRGDFVDKYEKFAAWAETSGGFEIH